MKNKPYRYVICDPDVRNAAYAIVGSRGQYIDSWVIKAKDLEESARIHATEPPMEIVGESLDDYNYILVVESQQFYQGDSPKLVKSLLQLGRACGISMAYLARMFPSHEKLELILPRVWTRGRPKLINQYHAIKNQGWTPVKSQSVKSYHYAQELKKKHKMTEQKHVMDAIAIGMFYAEQHQKQLRLKNFRKSMK